VELAAWAELAVSAAQRVEPAALVTEVTEVPAAQGEPEAPGALAA
jgi:hypothetical protein